LPTGFLALSLLFFNLNLNPHQPKPWREVVSQFDFAGLGSIVAGVILLIVGFNNGGISWQEPLTISCIAIGSLLLIFAGYIESSTTKMAIIPPRLFRTRTTALILVSAFIPTLPRVFSSSNAN
jgi:hypothetical protein